MKKWITLLKSIVLSFLIYMWFLGSSLLIQIDSQQQYLTNHQMYIQKWEQEMRSISGNINSYCRRLELKRLQESVAMNRTVQAVEGVSKQIDVNLEEKKREKIIRDNLIYIPEHRQMWCLVPKAASTSWSHKIVESLKVQSTKFKKDLQNTSVPIQVALRKHYGHVSKKMYNEILHSENLRRIILVRHPFSRLVSAYEDKLKDRKANFDSMYFYGHYGVKINRSFRKNRRLDKRKEPTFEEFVEYLIQTDPLDYDEHWKPVSLLCGMCHIKYDQIIRQEELALNLRFHMEQLKFNITELKKENARRGNSRGNYRRSNHFANISWQKIRQLYKKYEDDFRLFGYGDVPY